MFWNDNFKFRGSLPGYCFISISIFAANKKCKTKKEAGSV